MSPYRDLLDSIEKCKKKLVKTRMFKQHNCPVCGKELIRLEPYEETDEGIEFDYWCDDCNVDITITAPKDIFDELKEKEND